MLKRIKGRLLLILLVVTGFAGTLNDSTLTKEERKLAINQLKDTKTDLLKSIRGLSETQLNFKQSPDRWSIKECFNHLTLAEAGFWEMLETSMKEHAAPEKRSQVKISDEDLLKRITDRSVKAKAPEFFQPSKAEWKSMNEAVTAFKSSRSKHLKYAKTTTEDLRNHFVQLPFGWIDCYQFIIFISGHNNRHTQQINEIIANTGFPKS
ncbi:MAG TPA: DinB family protein [Chitinophagaceae bacterium]|nr:DinB family protein [Chitinophagaceae bacterium]